MAATVFTENWPHAGGYLVQELPGFMSKEAILVAASQTLKAGQVCAVQAVPASVTSSVSAIVGTGGGTLTLDVTNPVDAGVQNGVYKVRNVLVAAGGGTFEVVDPNGVVLGNVAVGATFDNQIKFVIADGAPDFALGDTFNVTVGVEADDQVAVAFNHAGADGAEIAAAICFADVTTGVGETKLATFHVRGTEVRATDLIWPAGITAAQQAAATEQLRARGIILR